MMTLPATLRKAVAGLLLLIPAATVWGDTPTQPAAINVATPDSITSGAGKYMWVPDSLVHDVHSVLRGEAGVHHYDPKPEFDLVIVRGDTVSQVLRDRNLGRFDRGLFNYLFIPKGSWQVGATASYGKFDASDLKLLDLIGDLDFKVSAFSIKPYLSYTVANNLAVGLRFGYTKVNGDIGNMQVDFDDDLNFTLDDVRYRNESYTSAFFVRQYIGLSRAGRFGIFNEMELSFSSGNSDFRRMYDSRPKSTHTSFMNASLNFSPGLCVFIMDEVSFNISLGVFGFYLRNEKQRSYMVNPEDAELYPDESANRFTSGASFRFNIFNINFGLGIHF